MKNLIKASAVIVLMSMLSGCIIHDRGYHGHGGWRHGYNAGYNAGEHNVPPPPPPRRW